MCTIFSVLRDCCCSKTLVSSAKSMVTLMSEPVVKGHNWPKMGSRSDARKSKSLPCQSLDYPRVPARAPPPTSPPQESSTSWNPANSRSCKEATGNWRKEAACRVFENGWWLHREPRGAQVPAAANISHNSDLERLMTNCTKEAQYSLPEIHQNARSASEPTGHFRRRRTGDSVPRTKLVTWSEPITNSLTKMWIIKTIIDTQSWFKI